MGETVREQSLRQALAWLELKSSPTSQAYKLLCAVVRLAVESPDSPVARADALMKLGEKPDLEPSAYARTADVERAWPIVVSHCSSADRANLLFPELLVEKPGRTLTYRFVWPSDHDPDHDFSLLDGCIRYRRALTTESLTWLARLQFRAPEIDITPLGRRLIVVGPILMYIVACVLLALMAATTMALSGVAPTWQQVYTATAAAGFSALVYFARIHPALANKADRLGLYPEHQLRIGAIPAALEYINDEGRRLVRTVVYTGTCPICSSDVHLGKGRHDLKGRVVGACIESPVEHVFSFDRMTLEGVALRAKPRDKRSSRDRTPQ